MSGTLFGSDLDWTCHVCGRRRPDRLISVATHTHIFPNGIEEKDNVRYCNDTPACGAAAMIRDHSTLLAQRLRLEKNALEEALNFRVEDGEARCLRFALAALVTGLVAGNFIGWTPFT